MADAKPMLMRKTVDNVCNRSLGIVCVRTGKVKTSPSTATAESAENGRGQAIKVLETG